MALIDHWLLNEGSGSTATSIGSNGTVLDLLEGAAWLTSGGYDGSACVVLGGIGGDRLNCFPWNLPSTFPGMSGGPTTFSIAGWFYIDGTVGTPGFIHPFFNMDEDSQPAPYRSYQLNAADSSNGLFPTWSIWRNDSTGTTITSNSPISGNTWHHIAATYQYVTNGTSRMRLYLDGQLVATTETAVGPVQEVYQPIQIGRWVNIGNTVFKFLDGRIDDIRVYDHAISSTEASNLAQTTPGSAAVSYWAFDDGSGTIAQDSDGSNDLILANGPSWVSSPNALKIGALSFDGYNDYAYRDDNSLSGIPGQNDGTGGNTFTISVWFYINETLSASKRYPLINKYGMKLSAVDGGWAIFASNATSNFRPEFWIYAGGFTNGPYKTVITSNTPISANTWHHLVAQYSGNGIQYTQASDMTLWLDNTIVASTNTAWWEVDTSPQPLEFGRYKNNRFGEEFYSKVRLDETRIFNYWLDAGEIDYLNNVATIVSLTGQRFSFSDPGILKLIYPGFQDLTGISLATNTAIEAGIYTNVELNSQSLSLPLASIGTSTDSDLIDWLQENKGVRSILMEAVYHDGTTTGTVYLSNTGYITNNDDTPANTPYIDALIDIPEIFESINSTGGASITIENSSGERDFWLLDYSFNGWPLTIYMGDPNWERWQYREIMSGITENVTAKNAHQLQFQLIDKSAIFDTPVQTNYMAGELADERALVPISLGTVINVPCVLVSETSHRYKVHESTISSIMQARAAGWSRSFTAFLSVGEFTFGQDWEAEVTADIFGATNGQAANMIEWLALRAGLTSGEIDAASFSNFPNTEMLGYWVDSDKSIGAIIDEILATVGGFKRFTARGILQILRLDLPQPGGSILTDDDILEDGIEPISVQSPRLTTQMGYYRRWLVQSPANLLAGISEATRYKSTTEYKRVYSTNTGIDAQFPLAETTDLIPTLFYDEAAAQTETNRRRDIRANRLYTFRVLAYSLPFEFNVGDSINITFPRYGFENGRDMRILSVRQKPTENIVEMEVWGP